MALCLAARIVQHQRHLTTSAVPLLVGWQEEHLACKKIEHPSGVAKSCTSFAGVKVGMSLLPDSR